MRTFVHTVHEGKVCVRLYTLYMKVKYAYVCTLYIKVKYI